MVYFLFGGGAGLIIANHRIDSCCSVVVLTDWHESSLRTKPRALVDSFFHTQWSCDCVTKYRCAQLCGPPFSGLGQVT